MVKYIRLLFVTIFIMFCTLSTSVLAGGNAKKASTRVAPPLFFVDQRPEGVSLEVAEQVSKRQEALLKVLLGAANNTYVVGDSFENRMKLLFSENNLSSDLTGDDTDNVITDTLWDWFGQIRDMLQGSEDYNQQVTDSLGQADQTIHSRLDQFYQSFTNYFYYPRLVQYVTNVSQTVYETTDAINAEAKIGAERLLALTLGTAYEEDAIPIVKEGVKQLKAAEEDYIRESVEQFIDILTKNPEKVELILSDLLESADDAEILIIANNLDQLSLPDSNHPDGSATSWVKKLSCWGDCYCASESTEASASAYRNEGKSGVRVKLRRSPRLNAHCINMATPKKESSKMKSKPEYVKELAGIIEQLKMNDLLDTETGIKPSNLDIDEDVKQRRMNWQKAKEKQEALLQAQAKATSSQVPDTEFVQGHKKVVSKKGKKKLHSRLAEKAKAKAKALSFMVSLELAHDRMANEKESKKMLAKK